MATNQVNRTFEVPTNIAGKLSKTSDAATCFVNRQFSSILQSYLTTYVVSTTSFYSLYSGYTGNK